MKKCFLSVILCLFILSSLLCVPASANSAQQRWSGVDATGAIVTEGGSPIVVESELLTFDIPEFPSNYYSSEEDFLSYEGKVTAKYSFFNPSDMTVTAKLAFPFGTLPSYAYGEDIESPQYSVCINGTKAESNVRYTLSGFDRDFNIKQELPLISDNYIETDFYKPDTTVTLYKWTVSDIASQYRAATIAFDISAEDCERTYRLVGQSGGHTQKDGDYRISDFVKNNDSIIIYVFGKPLDSLPELKLYENGGVEDGEEILGTIAYKGEEKMTLEEFALSNREEESPISEIDWYNAVITELSEKGRNGNYPVVDLSRYESRFNGQLMRWYQYEITLAPNERIINTVTAPMYPAIDMSYVPTVCNYAYLISPASTWADFGELKIHINTPYYITKSSYEGFNKTDSGYELTLDGLPRDNDGEVIDLFFSLSTEEDPLPKSRTPGGIMTNLIYFLTLFGVPIIIGIAVLAIIIFIIKKILKK